MWGAAAAAASRTGCLALGSGTRRATCGPGLRSARDVEQLAEQAGSISYRSNMAPQPGIETEAAPGGMEREHEHHDRQEHVGPRPFGGIAGLINAEPEVQHEYDSKR